jgi:hypothetical protein
MSEAELVPSKSIRLLVSTLRSIGLEFALVGGVAVAMVATPRFTADIDAVILDVDHRLEWLVTTLTDAGYKPRTSDPIEFARRTRVLTMRDPTGVGIDLMLGLLPFDEELVRQALMLNLADSTVVPVATPEHLMVMKAIAWRPQDQQDIRELIAINPNMDLVAVVQQVFEYLELLEVPERVDELRALIDSCISK